MQAIYQKLDREVKEETRLVVRYHNLLGTPRHREGVNGLTALGWKVECWELVDGKWKGENTP